ncbi:unnamed protein product [Effrenium voratum]|nr:unnamed protein product [Effrenium voratum]
MSQHNQNIDAFGAVSVSVGSVASLEVSSSDEAGEGEHKIMVELRRNESAKTEEAHVIVGTDSDLLLVPLALLHGPKRVTVARAESPAELPGTPADQLLPPGKWAPGFGPGCPFLVRVCRSEAVLDAMARQWNRFAPALVPLDEMHLRLDFLLVTCFRGNDYLPALACDCDPSELWPRYLRWRQSSQSLVGVELEDDAEKIVLMRLPFVDFLSQQGGAVLATSAGKTAEEASQYVEALLWCLETYATGCCPDPLRRFGASAPNAAHVSAEALARQLGGEPGCFKAARSDAAFLTPLGCALAVLPVAEVRRLVLPFEPCLAPLLEENGLLGKVAQLESCTECAALTKQVVAGPVSGKKAEKRRKALEVHRRQHQDIENVSLEELEAEVRRLQELRGDEPLGADAARPAAGESSAQKAELAGAKHKRARKRQRR